MSKRLDPKLAQELEHEAARAEAAAATDPEAEFPTGASIAWPNRETDRCGSDTRGVTSVEFRLRSEELGSGVALTVTPYLDGVSLVELARRVETAPAAQGGEPDLAGSYAGLVVGDRRWQDWYTGERPQTWFDDGDSCLLGCTCGDTGCWPLTARVALDDGQVTWSGFRTGHRPWDLTGLGPFHFDRRDYERSLANPVTD